MHGVHGVLSAWLSRAKLWWGASLTVQVLVSLGAGLSALRGGVPPAWPLFLGVASIVGVLGRWRADVLRQRAEKLLRQVELEDGLGWLVNPKLIADTLARAIGLESMAENRAREQGNFFASSRERSASRLLDNLRESAWWTQQNAEWLGWIVVWIVLMLVVLAVLSLLVASTIIGPPSALDVSRLLTAGISVVFAGNLIRLPFDYFRLAVAGSEADRMASEMVRAQTAPTEADALRLLGDYQLARAMGPPIPDWVWRRRREHLNAIWDATRIKN